MQLVCKKCGYAWEYAGNKHRTSCSKCKTSITIHDAPQVIKSTSQLPVAAVPQDIDMKLSLQLLESYAFIKAKAWAKTNGEDYITLKPNSEGILSL